MLIELTPELFVEELTHPFDEVGSEFAGIGLSREAQRVSARKTGVGVAYSAVATHQLEDRVPALDDAVGEAAWIISARSLRDRRERRRFGEVQIFHGLSEVALGGTLDAVCTIAQIDLIEVQLENAIFRILGFDRARNFGFLQLSHEILLARDALRKDVSGELHGDRGEALAPAVRAHIVDDRGRHALPVDSGVLVESLVLGRDERLANDRGNLLELHDRAPLETDLGDEAAVRGVQLGRLTGGVLVEHFDRWAASGPADEGPARVKQSNRKGNPERGTDEQAPHDSRMLFAESVEGCYRMERSHKRQDSCEPSLTRLFFDDHDNGNSHIARRTTVARTVVSAYRGRHRVVPAWHYVGVRGLRSDGEESAHR